MTDPATIADLLHEAAESHHVVYRIVDGDDPDWASWYADWREERWEDWYAERLLAEFGG